MALEKGDEDLMSRNDDEWRSSGQWRNDKTAAECHQEKAMGFHWVRIRKRRRSRKEDPGRRNIRGKAQRKIKIVD